VIWKKYLRQKRQNIATNEKGLCGKKNMTLRQTKKRHTADERKPRLGQKNLDEIWKN